MLSFDKNGSSKPPYAHTILHPSPTQVMYYRRQKVTKQILDFESDIRAQSHVALEIVGHSFCLSGCLSSAACVERSLSSVEKHRRRPLSGQAGCKSSLMIKTAPFERSVAKKNNSVVHPQCVTIKVLVHPNRAKGTFSCRIGVQNLHCRSNLVSFK